MSREAPPLALGYHGVSNVPMRMDHHALFVSPRDLVRHIRALKRWGYSLVTFRELALALASGDASGLAALTFDDGFHDNATELPPILADEAVPATVFVTSGLLGQRHPVAPWTQVMTAEEVQALSAAGVEIGAHGRSHRDLTELSREEAREELAHSKTLLEELLDKPVDTAAYPYGRANDETRAACRAAGFIAACRTSANGRWSDPYDLPRQDMGNKSTMLGLRLKRDNRYEPAVRLLPFRAGRSIRRRVLRALS